MSTRTSKITWKQLSPIFADVVLSPWNLLVGGLLIRYLSPVNALASIVIGYAILAVVFVLYGGLGFKKRMQSAQIFQEVFSGKFSTVFIPLLLAFGQIGWASINISLGGTSFARLLHVPVPLGLISYTLAVGTMGAIGLYKLAYTRIVVIISSTSLALYIGLLKLHSGDLAGFLSYHPANQKSIYWGSSIVVASLISFATVSPDFFQSLKHKNDVARSTLLGIVLPGMVICFLGCLFFFNLQLNLAGLIASLSFPALANLFNTVANTDGSMALYTPALKFELVFKMRFVIGIIAGAIISLTLALLGIINYLEIWLKALSIISPIFIGVAFAAVLFDRKAFKSLPQTFSRYAYILTVAVCVLLLDHSVPVIVALLAPLVIYSVYIQYKLIHE
jgi:purine-cytosine permease-like protein